MKRSRISGWLKISILAMLVKGPMHGYAMIKEVERITGGEWVPAPGSLYPTLNELVREGMIEAREERVGGRKRVIYSITDKGVRFLVEKADKLISRAIPSIFKFIESQIIAINRSGNLEELRKVVEVLDFMARRAEELKRRIEVNPGATRSRRWPQRGRTTLS